MPIKKSSNI